MIIENVLKSVKKQGIYQDTEIEDIGINITLINDEFLPLCFILDEDEQYLSIVNTDLNGLEKINIISKDSIVRVAIVYSDDLIQEDDETEQKIDRMLV